MYLYVSFYDVFAGDISHVSVGVVYVFAGDMKVSSVMYSLGDISHVYVGASMLYLLVTSAMYL